MRAVEHALRSAQQRSAAGAELLSGSVRRSSNHRCASSSKTWDTNTPGRNRNVEKRVVGIQIFHSPGPMFLQRFRYNYFEGTRLRLLRYGYFVDRAVGKGASVPYRTERIRLVLEIGSVVGVIRRRFGRCPLTDVKLAGLVLNLLSLINCIQACCAGWRDGKDKLRLRTSLVRRANSRPKNESQWFVARK
jgi:hypothetical protein